MDFDSDEENVIEEDFYAFLNVPKEATKEEINNAYRRLSRMYHPDKHVDPALKAKAEVMFNKTKRAYEVLSDPHQRAIYDSLGTKGLETEGWEIVQRTKTPAEIRAEYEQLAEERAERKKKQATNPTGNITIAINATDLFNPYDDELFDDEYESDFISGIPTVEVSSMQFTQSVDFPLTQKDTCTLSGQLQTQNGTGGGGVNLSWRHIFSHKSWAELEMTAGSGPAVSFKGFRTLTKRFFWNGGTILQFTPEGIRPGIMSTLAMQIDKHSVGYLSYHGGGSVAVLHANHQGYREQPFQRLHPSRPAALVRLTSVHPQDDESGIETQSGWLGPSADSSSTAQRRRSRSTATSRSPSSAGCPPALTRASQTYSFPIHLCEEIMPAPVFYATIVPLVAYVVVKKGLVEPILREEKSKKVEKQKQDNYNKLLEKRREAMAAQDLMMATYDRIREEETRKKGLVVVKAVYGRLFAEASGQGQGDMELSNEVLDVTVPVQCLVKDSKLTIHDRTKSELPGFFDPALGEEKMLHIIYNYHEQPHEVTISDNEPLRLPKTSHRANVT
ncbi:hypothetical protein NQ318_020098 [Aromia moschata]|uniref:J domain-containing protein n=1 Tax=Aromia moschata TaxID=1265417 RepID=A0AAV8Z935_9CUCU|nr:hypothetical protein NQ318_020098 [Aromia moschata]